MRFSLFLFYIQLTDKPSRVLLCYWDNTLAEVSYMHRNKASCFVILQIPYIGIRSVAKHFSFQLMVRVSFKMNQESTIRGNWTIQKSIWKWWMYIFQIENNFTRYITSWVFKLWKCVNAQNWKIPIIKFILSSKFYIPFSG